MITQEMLDAKEFHIWLLSHNLNSWVGYTNNPCDCPIANYVKSKANVPDKLYVTVTGMVVGLCNANFDPVQKTAIPLPEWARQFIMKIDSDDVAAHVNAIVTTEQALNVLSEVLSSQA